MGTRGPCPDTSIHSLTRKKGAQLSSTRFKNVKKNVFIYIKAIQKFKKSEYNRENVRFNELKCDEWWRGTDANTTTKVNITEVIGEDVVSHQTI